MKVCRRIPEVRAAIPRDRGTVGFVPTMGALHDGHLSLLDAARRDCAVVVLSIFVNPLQFSPSEDLATYPRTEDEDLRLAEEHGVDVAFLPSVEEMYAPTRSTTVTVGSVADLYEGAHRPGHFDGVATVVAKLFNIVAPTYAYFGQKDAQQVAVIKRMVADLSIDTEIVVCPTVREGDGLALSSRNVYLGPQDRTAAAVLWRSLEAGREALLAGSSADAEEAMWKVLAAEPGVDADYAAAVDPDDFGPPEGPAVLLVVAARVGGTRLIDNLLVETR